MGKMGKDNKKKMETIAIPILLLIFAGVLWTSLGQLGIFKAKKPSVRDEASFAGMARAPAVKIAPAVKRAANPVWGRDPFTLRETSSGEADSIHSLRLMGITRISDKDPYRAIINDEFVTAGSKIGNFTVIEINERAVKIKDDRESHTLRIREEL